MGTEERLGHQGILKYISLIIASAEEGVAKPDRRIFEIALERGILMGFIICGLNGAGKSTLGKVLAEKLKFYRH